MPFYDIEHTWSMRKAIHVYANNDVHAKELAALLTDETTATDPEAVYVDNSSSTAVYTEDGTELDDCEEI